MQIFIPGLVDVPWYQRIVSDTHKELSMRSGRTTYGIIYLLRNMDLISVSCEGQYTEAPASSIKFYGR